MRLLSVVLATVLLAAPQARGAGEAIAFVTETSGAARIERADGTGEAAEVGGQLAAGDQLAVSDGKAVLIYLSGRTVEVAAGQTHAVQEEGGEGSALLGRVMDTLGEIAGPGSEVTRPVVHGMARDLAVLEGALPANSVVSTGDFAFTWDAAEGASGYEVTLMDTAGAVLAQRTTEETRLPANELDLEPGVRYTWEVREADSFVPRTSGASWVEVATPSTAARIARSLERIAADIEGPTAALLQAALLFREQCYWEAEQFLAGVGEKRALNHTETRLLHLAYARMERWERLPESGEAAPADEAAE